MQECNTVRTTESEDTFGATCAQQQQHRVTPGPVRVGVVLLVAAGFSLLAAPLAAQEPATEAETSTEPAPPAEPVPEAVPEKPVVGGPAEPQPEVQAKIPEEQPATESVNEEDAPTPSVAPALKIGMGVRTGLALQVNQPGSDKVGFTLNDGLVDQLHIRPYFSAQLTKRVGVVANFEIGTQGGLGRFNVLDAIVQVKFFDELQLWVGQHIPANDRNNFSGPFFHNSWNFAIDVPSYSFDQGARDRGFTFWGLIAGGILKYHLSLVDLQPGRNIENARFSGRVTLNLLDPENYYYASGTYYGAQDTLALGAVFSYQNGVGGDKADNDFIGYSFDGLFEKTTNGAGTYTLEAGYWNFDKVGYNYVVNQGTIDQGIGVVGPAPGQAVLVGVSWLTQDNVGYGKIQPNARFQWGDYSSKDPTSGDKVSTVHKVVDVGIGYIIDGFNHRWHLNYRHADRGGKKEDMVQAGIQIQI